MDALELFNACEAAMWFLLAIISLLKSRGTSPSRQRKIYALALWLTLFGISDIIEFHTGSWWQPWWLLVLKGACLGGLFFNLWSLWRNVSQPPA